MPTSKNRRKGGKSKHYNRMKTDNQMIAGFIRGLVVSWHDDFQSGRFKPEIHAEIYHPIKSRRAFAIQSFQEFRKEITSEIPMKWRVELSCCCIDGEGNKYSEDAELSFYGVINELSSYLVATANELKKSCNPNHYQHFYIEVEKL